VWHEAFFGNKFLGDFETSVLEVLKNPNVIAIKKKFPLADLKQRAGKKD
jgi:hypothetical protein